MSGDRMRIELTITDEDGNTFSGDAELLQVSGRQRKVKSSEPKSPKQSNSAGKGSTSVNLGLPIRNFIKGYSKGMSGPKKFTLLLAKLCNGKTGVAVDVKELAKSWGKMTAFLGDFNAAYPTRAKDEGWVDSLEMGKYVLRPNWKEIF